MRIKLLVLLLVSINSWAGNEHGNGGDGYALEFVALGRKMLDEVRKNPDPRISPEDLLQAIEGTKVVTASKLELNGVEVDAINYPEQKRIELNRSRWPDYDLAQKSSLVLHEYLGILGVQDSQYEVSGKYLPMPVSSSEVAEMSKKQGRFSISAGSGYSTFSHNAGKIYEPAAPSLEVRVNYDLSPSFTLRTEGSKSKYFSDMTVTGPMNMILYTVGLSLQYHLTQSSYWRDHLGMDPYVFAGAGYVFQEYEFVEVIKIRNKTLKFPQDYGWDWKDEFFNISAGAGMNFFFIKKKAAFWLEGKVANDFSYKYNSYEEDGVSDTKGLLLSGLGGVSYFF